MNLIFSLIIEVIVVFAASLALFSGCVLALAALFTAWFRRWLPASASQRAFLLGGARANRYSKEEAEAKLLRIKELWNWSRLMNLSGLPVIFYRPASRTGGTRQITQ